MVHRIRPIVLRDLDFLKSIIDSTDLFPSELLDGMTGDFFNNPSTEDIWLTLVLNEKPVAVAYCAPERLTSGTFNLYLIAVLKQHQGNGLGAALLEFIERHLGSMGHRILLVETSGLPEFELTRRFYDQCGYHREARIRDFYKEGEDKIVFWKKLSQVTSSSPV